MKKTNINDIIKCLRELNKSFSNRSLMFHMALATEEYGDISNLSDKELLFALEKYLTLQELEIESQITEFYDADEEEDF